MKKQLILMTIASVSFSVFAEIKVIVHPSNANAFDANTISKIFLGKAKTFPDGSQALAINQDEAQAATSEFNEKVLSKSGSQLKAYWSKLVFTGKGTPPKEVTTDAEVVALIAANPNFIGYVDASAVDDNVKVVASF